LRDYYNSFYDQELKECNILFTYDVIWRQSNKTFFSRWDRYIKNSKEYHWLGLIFSNIILFIFSFLLIIIDCPL
jgi:hypothetical protein